MFNKYLQETNPKATEYFETLINSYFENKKNMPNSIILWGSDTLTQYFFAMEIARNLNCKKNREVNCDCLNCNWIRSNSHPEIKTISKIDLKPDGDKTKVISVKQIQQLLNEISVKSEEYRVVIFCDADYEKISEDKKNHLENYCELKNVIKSKGEKYWTPKPLHIGVFQEESENALLKTLEEPPQNLLFIFLTSSPDDLISTIVSRSQMFYIQNTFMPSYDFTFCKDLFNTFPNFERNNFDEYTQKSLAYIKENEMNMQSYLELQQAYFTKLLLNNYNNPQIKEKVLNIIKTLIQSKKYDLSSIKPQYVLDNLWINIS